MVQHNRTATTDTWAQPIDGMATVERPAGPLSFVACDRRTGQLTVNDAAADGFARAAATGHLPRSACIVCPPTAPGLELEVPSDVADRIKKLARAALGPTMVGVPTLPSFEQLPTVTTFGPSADRLREGGLDAATAAALARWGGAVFHVANALTDARAVAEWHAGKTGRSAERHKAAGRVDDEIVKRHRTGFGVWNVKTAMAVRDARLSEPDDPKPLPDVEARSARLAVAALEGRLISLLWSGGLPARFAVGLAALMDPVGWGELAMLVPATGAVLPGMKAAAKTSPRGPMDALAYDSTAHIGQAWQPVPQLGFRQPPTPTRTA